MAKEKIKKQYLNGYERILKIDHLIASGKYPSVKELAQATEASIPTINRDLNNLRILLVVGPEGGFTDSEEKILIDNGFISTTFRRRVLRTETASLYALSIINYILM